MTAPLSTAAAASSPDASALVADVRTIGVLWRRDMLRFYREKTRIVGALVQPLIFWLVIGSGMSSTFRLPGAEQTSYLAYFFPGVVLMVVLFTSIFTTMSVIEDRHQGFLQAVLVGPGSRASVVLGKALGASTVAIVQAMLFIALGPFAGFPYAGMSFVLLVPALVLTAVSLTAMGFAVAWWLDSTAAYHVVMSVGLLPLWILSGAMFPLPRIAWLQSVLAINPMTHAVALFRGALYGDALPAAMAAGSPAVDLAILAVGAVVMVGLGVFAIERRR